MSTFGRSGRRSTEPRLPFDDLLKRSGRADAVIICEGRAVADWRGKDRTGSYDIAAPLTIFAELVGVERRTVNRWKESGIPLSTAEDLCFFLGMHPLDVWPDAYLIAVLKDSEDWEPA